MTVHFIGAGALLLGGGSVWSAMGEQRLRLREMMFSKV